MEEPLFKRWRLIVFDFDGTLVDSQHSIVAIMGRAFAGAGLEAPAAAEVRRTVGLSLEHAIEELLGEGRRHHTSEVSGHYRREAIAHRQSREFHEPLFPGAREALERLDTPEMRLGIATGKNMRGLRFSLDHHRLERHFVTLQTADRGPGKPDPFMLSEAMAEAGVSAAETVMVGDTSFDMLMARHARVTSIGVAWGYHEAHELLHCGAATVLEHFDELIPALRAAEERDR